LGEHDIELNREVYKGKAEFPRQSYKAITLPNATVAGKEITLIGIDFTVKGVFYDDFRADRALP
jgi:hypothetical protein